MRFPSCVVAVGLVVLAASACGPGTSASSGRDSAPAPAVAKPKTVASPADCAKYLSAGEVRAGAGVQAATPQSGEPAGDCSFDLSERPDGSGGQVQLVFGAAGSTPDMTPSTFDGNAAAEKRDKPGADSDSCRFVVRLQPGGGPTSAMSISVLRFTKGKDVCSAAHDIARIVFDKLPS